jgi:hypothetical protein
MKNVSLFFIFLFTVLTIKCFGQVRPDLITDFTPEERDTLVNLMQDYITVQVIEWHCDYGAFEDDIHDDFNFLPFHRVYIGGMEDYFILNGHPEFVPLPNWEPNTPTPIEFQVVDADCMSTVCTNNVPSGGPSVYCLTPTNWNPNEPLPGYLQIPNPDPNEPELCDHPFSPTEPGGKDKFGLSRQIENPYHNGVHMDMGGNMFGFASPASPIFWCFHAYLDDLWKEWECNCPLQSTTASVDLYMKDNNYIMQNIRDRGEEPNIDPGTMSESPDIWIRSLPDGLTNDTTQIPQYISPTSPVYVYVRVRNRGCQASTGNETLSLHWAKGSTALTWPSFWNGTTTAPALMGNLIGTQTIPVTNVGNSTIVVYQWFPPNPDDYNGINADPDLFCLVVRQESTNDPMTFPEGADIDQNVRNNNHIVWRNTTVQNNPALPIELSYFSGKRIRNEVQLSWQTNSEIQNKGFEIYRSSSNRAWEELGWVYGNGSSTQQHVYAFDDTQPVYGINYYRLKQIDFDGAFEYSKIIAIENDNSDFKIQVFPNPTSSNFNIRIANPLLQKMRIQINDNLGMNIWESNSIVGESAWNKELEIERNGVYLITVQIGNETYYERIVILNY